jgi:hypothetical protein
MILSLSLHFLCAGRLRQETSAVLHDSGKNATAVDLFPGSAVEWKKVSNH